MIALRADAGPQLGAGHVMRVLCVAEALRERGVGCVLVSAELPSSLEERARALGVAVRRIDAEPGSAADLEATLACVRKVGARAVLVDSYRLPTQWRAGLARAGLGVGVFDDLNDAGPLHADLVINAAGHAEALGYGGTAPGARLLLGLDYLAIRREIRAAASIAREARDALLLTFGGADPLGLTEPCVTALASRLEGDERIVVVVGGADPRAAAVVESTRGWGQRVEVRQDVREMGPLMARARLAVAAAGVTAGELACVGVPTLLVVVAENQAGSAQAFAARGIGRVIDGRERGAVEAIVEQAIALARDGAALEALARRARDAVDGRGAERIAEALMAIAARKDRTA